MKRNQIPAVKSAAAALLVIVITFALTGCAHFSGYNKHRQNASVVDFLFPKGSPEIEPAAVPTLNLPLDVGIAFVPATTHDRNEGQALTEEAKVRLLESVAREFREYKFVRKIEIIPSAYLRHAGGFANLDQVSNMFGVQIIALVSYDQMQFTDEDFVSLAYWTLIGAYVIEGEKNDTQTLLDAVVYDVATRKLLLRAPGSSRLEARSTPVNLTEELREDSRTGFKNASTNLVSNLKTELASFQDRLRKSPEEVKFVTQPGYTGAGSIGLIPLSALILLAFAGGVFHRKAK